MTNLTPLLLILLLVIILYLMLFQLAFFSEKLQEAVWEQLNSFYYFIPDIL